LLWEDAIFNDCNATQQAERHFEVTYRNFSSFPSLCWKLYSLRCYSFPTVIVWNVGGLTKTLYILKWVVM
jgi:hypothetical protein